MENKQLTTLLIDFFNLPEFKDEETNRKARIIYYIVISVFAGFFIFVLQRVFRGDIASIELFSIVLLLLFIAFFLVVKGDTYFSGKLLVLILQGFTFYRAFTFNGIHDTILFAIPGTLVIAGLILSKRGFFISTLASIVTIAILGYLEINGYITTFFHYVTTYNHVFDRLIIIIITAIGVLLFTNETEKSLFRTKKSEEELRKTTDMLKESEQKFRTLYENSSFPLLLLDENLIIIDCNLASVNLFKVSHKKRLLGKTPLDFSPEFQSAGISSIEVSDQNLKITVEKGYKTFEWVHLKQTGEKFIAEITMTKIVSTDKSMYLCNLKDITERKLFENEIYEKQLFIERITEQTPDLIYINDTEINETIYANRNLLETLGYDLKKIPSNTKKFFEQILHPDDEHQFLDYYDRKLEDDDSIVYNYQYRLKDAKGEWRWFTGKEKVFQREEGKVVSVIGTLRDITNLKKTEEGLERERLFTSTILDSVPGILYVYSKEGLLKRWNKNHETYTGYSAEELKNKHILTWFDESDKIKVLAETGKTFENDKSEVEANLIIKSGEKIPYYFTGVKMISDCEEYLVGYGIDISARLANEEALIKSEEKFYLLFNESPNALIILNYETRLITDINELACESLGINKENVIGKTFDDLSIIDKKMREKFLEIIISEGRIRNYELDIKLKGENRIGLAYGQLIYINNAKHLFLTVVDITEFKKVSDALKKSEELYRTLMDNMNEAVIQVDNNDSIIYVNNSFEKLLGYKYEEVIGKTGYELLMDPESRYIMIENNKNRLKGVSEQYEISFKSKFGKYIDLLISASPIKDTTGNVIGSIGVMTDITEWKKAVNMLRASEEKFRLLAENASDVIMVQNIDGIFTYLSPASLKVFGYEPEELIGKSPKILISEEDNEILENAYRSKNFLKNNYVFTFKSKTKSCETVWIEATSTIVRDVYDVPKEIQTLARDITQRKIMESELEDVVNFVKHIINSLPIGLISVDEEFKVNLYNQASTNFKNDLIDSKDKNVYELYPILNGISSKISGCIKKKEIVEEIISSIDDMGDMRYIKYVITPIQRLNKPGCVILIEDITKARNMEQLMIQSEKMLSVAGLAAGMAHEINNPLGTIVQGCQNILRRVSPELPKNIETAKELGIDINLLETYFEQRQIFEIIESMRNASAKASDIIKNMLQFSRRSESKRVLYSIERLIDQTNELANNDYDFKKKYDYRSIRVIKEYERNLPEIKITVTEMEQVIFNLIRNAVQALREENNQTKIPTIYLRAYKDEKYLRIEVEDNGPGIPEKIKSRIFEPFFTTKDIGEGTGLGLSVSYMIITNNHNGFLEVESKEGAGTKFIIKLPL